MKPAVATEARQQVLELRRRHSLREVVDLNATQAAIRAGYAKGSADVTGTRLLANASVMSAIRERQKDRQERTEITQDMVFNRWWQLANADPYALG